MNIIKKCDDEGRHRKICQRIDEYKHKRLEEISKGLPKLKREDIIKFRTEEGKEKIYWDRRGIVKDVTANDKIIISPINPDGTAGRPTDSEKRCETTK